jgi:ABC-type transport system involved in multi-copper enzyme maturation permease subunit
VSIVWIALFTVKEILRSKILVGVIFLSFFIAFFSFLASEFTFGVPTRVALDLGIGGMSISNIAISLFFGVTLLTKEIDSRTIYLTLVHPVSRWEFLIGKALGLLIVIFINTLILSFIALSAFFILGGSLSSILVWTVCFSFLEASLLLVIVLFFSLITNSTISVLSGIGTYLVGQTISTIIPSYFVQKSPVLKMILGVAVKIIPDFDRFNIKQFLLYKQDLPVEYLVNTALYGVFYIPTIVHNSH